MKLDNSLPSRTYYFKNSKY